MTMIQATLDGLSAQWQRERATEQMTLGKMIDRLEQIPPDTIIELGEPDSYRGYYCDLAFEPDRDGTKASALLEMCRSSMGKMFTGYKGGEYIMGELTPVWKACYGCCGKKIMAINDDGSIETAEDD